MTIRYILCYILSISIILVCCLCVPSSSSLSRFSSSLTESRQSRHKIDRARDIMLESEFKHIQKSTTWEIPQYVWGYGLALEADVGSMKSQNPYEYFQKPPTRSPETYQTIKHGDSVWICADMIPWFCDHVLPTLTVRIVLIASLADNSFPDDCGSNVNRLLTSPYISHIFAQNFHYRPEWAHKVTHIPIGVDFHTPAYKQNSRFLEYNQYLPPLYQEKLLHLIIDTLLPRNQRKLAAFVDFQHFDSLKDGCFHRDHQLGENRTQIFQTVMKSGVVEYDTQWTKRSDLWRTKGTYAFSISPHGNGLDCHRTWEDLILGCIVIVKTSPLDLMYQDLPVVIVQDWHQVTQENMKLWLNQHETAKLLPKLTHSYWMSQIQKQKQLL